MMVHAKANIRGYRYSPNSAAQMNNLTRFLYKPFPQEEDISDAIRIITVISLFVVGFLYVFKPFGLHLKESGLFFLCLGFGTVTFAVSILYELLLRYVLKIKGEQARYTFGKWTLYMAGIILCISLANFVFVRVTLFNDIQWGLYPYMLRGTFAVGFFPIIVLGAIAMLRQEKKYQNIADELNHQTRTDHIKQSDNPEIFGVPSSQVKYIEAMQNYINIGHIDPNGLFKVQTERATIKSLANQTLGNSIMRCHRSFLVNRESIASTAGNAQGLLLSLTDCEKKIPVSRSYVADFRNR